MLYFDSIDDAAEVFKALSTPMRLKIMEMISEDNEMSMNDLAEALGLTNSAISLHVSKLEQAGLVSIHTTAGKRGSMKIVKPIHDRLLVNLTPAKEKRMKRSFTSCRSSLSKCCLVGGTCTAKFDTQPIYSFLSLSLK